MRCSGSRGERVRPRAGRREDDEVPGGMIGAACWGASRAWPGVSS
jgi:hypothetical protein